MSQLSIVVSLGQKAAGQDFRLCVGGCLCVCACVHEGLLMLWGTESLWTVTLTTEIIIFKFKVTTWFTFVVWLWFLGQVVVKSQSKSPRMCVYGVV